MSEFKVSPGATAVTGVSVDEVGRIILRWQDANFNVQQLDLTEEIERIVESRMSKMFGEMK